MDTEERDNERLRAILASARRIVEYTRSFTLEKFLTHPQTHDAVVLHFKIIAESAHRISDDTKQHNSELPWEAMSAWRKRLARSFEYVDYDAVWHDSQTTIVTIVEQICGEAHNAKATSS